MWGVAFTVCVAFTARGFIFFVRELSQAKANQLINAETFYGNGR
jgi:predicted Co/Zn/Cd cation transporter (cation efflux family)